MPKPSRSMVELGIVKYTQGQFPQVSKLVNSNMFGNVPPENLMLIMLLFN